jgi:hypothetical protein
LGPDVEVQEDVDDINRNFMIYIRKLCCTCGGEERCTHGVGRGNLKEGNYRRPRHKWVIFDESLRSGMGSTDWVGVAQDRGSW